MRCAAVVVLGLVLPSLAAAESFLPAETVLIGVLSKQFTPRCVSGPQGEKDVWGEPSHFEIGFVPVEKTTIPGPNLDALVGKLVVARGRVVDGAAAKPARGGACLERMQMRSDWVLSKDGFRLYTERTGALASIGRFRIDEVRAEEQLLGVTVLPAKGEEREAVAVRFRNPLEQELANVRIAGHYEGCYGKPGTRSAEIKLSSVEAGRAAEARLPAIVWADHGGRPAAHVLHSVRLYTTTPGVAFDLDYRVPREGLTCPARK